MIEIKTELGSTITLELDSLEGADLSYHDFHRALLSNMKMRAAILKGATLRNACLNNADLRECNLNEAGLMNAHLRRSRLENTQMRGSWLTGAVLDGANLSNADLSGADVAAASFRNCQLQSAILLVERIESANFDQAIFNDQTVWPEGFDPESAGAQRELHPNLTTKRGNLAQ